MIIRVLSSWSGLGNSMSEATVLSPKTGSFVSSATNTFSGMVPLWYYSMNFSSCFCCSARSSSRAFFAAVLVSFDFSYCSCLLVTSLLSKNISLSKSKAMQFSYWLTSPKSKGSSPFWAARPSLTRFWIWLTLSLTPSANSRISFLSASAFSFLCCAYSCCLSVT